MTITPRALQTIAVPSQVLATNRTAQAWHAYSLTDLANDAAGGHVAQRATVTRSQGGVFVLFYDPRSAARLLSLALTVSWAGTWSSAHGVTVDIAIADQSGNSLASSDTSIPEGLKGSFVHHPGLGPSRVDAMARTEYFLDLDTIATAGSLVTSEPWSITLTVTCGLSVYAELIELAEVARLAVDTADTFGEAPSDYVARSPIDAGLSRLGATLAAAADLNLRTHHHLAVSKAAALLVTSATWAVIPGVQSETVGVATTWQTAPRRLTSTNNVTIATHYKTSGADDGYLRLTTGTGNHDFTLPATSNVWTSLVAATPGSLANAATDDFSWAAKVDGGTLSLATFYAADAAP